MNCIGVVVVVLFAQLLLPSIATIAGEAGNQHEESNALSGANAPLREGKPLRGEPAYTVIRGAIFGDRRQLLSYLSDRRSRVALSTPALKETYELFQAALREELEVLWDLNFNASEYGLRRKERKDVKACIAEMEKYDDNFKAWEELNEAQEKK